MLTIPTLENKSNHVNKTLRFQTKCLTGVSQSRFQHVWNQSEYLNPWKQTICVELRTSSLERNFTFGTVCFSFHEAAPPCSLQASPLCSCWMCVCWTKALVVYVKVSPCGWVMKSRWPHLQRALPQKQHLHCLLFLHVAVGQARAIAFPSRAVPPVRLWDLLRGLFISCHFHQHAGTRRTRIITIPINCGLVKKQGLSFCSLICPAVPIQSKQGEWTENRIENQWKLCTRIFEGSG